MEADKITTSTKGGYTAAWWHMGLQIGLIFLLLMTAPIIPRLSVTLLFLLGALSLFYFWAVEKAFSGLMTGTDQPWLLAVFCGFAGYLLLNASWSLQTGVALGKAGLVCLIIGTVLVASSAFVRQNTIALEYTAKAIIWGAFLGVAIACFEFSTGHILARTLFGIFPGIRPTGNSIEIFIQDGGHLVQLPESEYRKPHENIVIKMVTAGQNRNLSLLLLVLWPTILLAAQMPKERLQWLIVGGILILSMITILVSESQTAQFGLLIGFLTFLLTKYWPRPTHWAMVSVWCVVLVFAVPLAAAPYKAGLHEAEWLFGSARDRIRIWNVTAQHAAKNPVLGVGIRSTRVIGRKMKKDATQTDSWDKEKRLGLHAHNQYLQIWFELGAIGAAFILAAGLGILQGMRKLTEDLRPFAYATFATACTVAAFGWGLWQSWLLAGYGLSILLIRFAANYRARAQTGS